MKTNINKTKMTAFEIIKCIEAMEAATTELYTTLQENFPQDEACIDCSFCTDFMDEVVDVPMWAKEAIGLDPEAKFTIIADEDSGRIILEPLEYENDLSDLTEEMRATLSEMGVCLGELNESLISGEMIEIVKN